jgi:hypothetical protein
MEIRLVYSIVFKLVVEWVFLVKTCGVLIIFGLKRFKKGFHAEPVIID